MLAFFKAAAGWLRSRKVELGLGVRVSVAAVAERFFALRFSLEQMRQNLKDMERCGLGRRAGSPKEHDGG